MKRTGGLAALALVTIAGLAPAAALSPQRALASAGTRAVTGAGVAGGTKLWVASYRDHVQLNSAADVVASPDGSTVFITGIAYDPFTGAGHTTTVAYNAATGRRRWVARYYGLGVSGPSSIAISPDGSRLFVAGDTTPPGSALPSRFAIVAYDSRTGAMLWAQHPFGDGQATAVTVSPDSAVVYATGTVGDFVDGLGSVATFAYNAATGAREWLAAYHALRPSAEAQSVAASPDGQRVFVSSPVTGSSGSLLIATVAYDAATGAASWARLTPGTADSPDRISAGRAIAVSPDSSAVFVTGMVPSASGTSAATTVAYAAATGAPLWSSRYMGPQGNNAGNAVAVSPDGSQVFVTGHSNGITSPFAQNFATVAYGAASGKQQWARTFSAPSTFNVVAIGAVAIGVSPDGSLVYVTGSAPGFRSNSGNFATIAYQSAGGRTSWEARYRGRRDFAGANSLAVGPTGQAVFVTGQVGAHDGCCNFATVAYQP